MTIIPLEFTMLTEERAARRAEIIAKYGVDFWISEEAYEEIKAIVEANYIVHKVEFTGFRLNFEISHSTKLTTRQRYDLETKLMQKYGNPPYNYCTDFMPYRLTFVAN
jgi:hypothetical protein